MNRIKKRPENLPVKPADLQKWILISKAKLAAQIKAIKSIDQLTDSVAARQAALADTQDLAEELLYAEARMGEMLKSINRGDSARLSRKGQSSKALPIGITYKQSKQSQELSRNEEAIAETVAKARDSGEVPVRNQVLRLIQANKPKPKTPPLPKGKYNVIYADPPWEYKNTGVDGAACEQYPTMSIAEICKMPIQEKAAKDAVLFMWVTNPLLEECFPVIKAWGFEYKTNFCWRKSNRKTGVGFYVRGVHELLLICTRGSMLPEYTPLSMLDYAAREHSRKPDEVYGLIMKMYPKGKRLELFARHKRQQWDSWGNEV